MRLDVASPAVQPAIDSRFVHYAHEVVYSLGPAKRRIAHKWSRAFAGESQPMITACSD